MHKFNMLVPRWVEAHPCLDVLSAPVVTAMVLDNCAEALERYPVRHNLTFERERERLANSIIRDKIVDDRLTDEELDNLSGD